jgi:ABC-type glycerol-3-phosphate transport system substrate-binding protein
MKALKRILLAVTMITPMLFVNCDWSELTANPFFDWLTVQMPAGTIEDGTVIYMDSNHATEWIATGALRPISELDTSGFDERLLPYFQSGGQTYALPQNCQTVAMVVNREMLDEAGLPVPTNWDELWAAAEALRMDNRFGVALTPGFWNYVPFLYQAGGALYVPETGDVVLDSPAAIQAMEFYSALYQHDLVYPGFSQGFVGEPPYWGTHGGFLEAFERREVAILFLGPGMYDRLLELMDLAPSSPDPVEVHTLPAGPKAQATIGMVRGFAVTGNAGQPLSEATRIFLEYMTGPEAMRFWIGGSDDSTSYIPALKSSQDQWLATHNYAAAFQWELENLQPRAPYPVYYAGALALENAVEETMMDAMVGTLTPEETMMKIQETATSIEEEFRVVSTR